MQCFCERFQFSDVPVKRGHHFLVYTESPQYREPLAWEAQHWWRPENTACCASPGPRCTKETSSEHSSEGEGLLVEREGRKKTVVENESCPNSVCMCMKLSKNNK